MGPLTPRHFLQASYDGLIRGKNVVGMFDMHAVLLAGEHLLFQFLQILPQSEAVSIAQVPADLFSV